MTKPVVVVVDDDAITLAYLETELTERYGVDYYVYAYGSAQAALEALEELRDAERHVALLLADLWTSPTSGIDLLVAAGALHRTARRAVIVDWATSASRSSVWSTLQRSVRSTAPSVTDRAARRGVPPSRDRPASGMGSAPRQPAEVVQVVGDLWSPAATR